jgi:hypothetical protein
LIYPDLTNAINEQIGRELGVIRKHPPQRTANKRDSPCFLAVFNALSFFWLDSFAIPALVVEPVETQRRYPTRSATHVEFCAYRMKGCQAHEKS